MAGGSTNSSMRKYMGSIKDTTTTYIAKVNSSFKEIDIAIVKATNHVERPAKEKHIRAIFAAVCATRPRADVAYCIQALSRRLSKTHNWAVALKTLIVIHRALREVDPTFHAELVNYRNSRSHLLNMSHFRDDSSACAWDYSAWVRAYALFLEERLECFRVLKYDFEMEPCRTKDLDTIDLLEQLPALHQLLYRVLACQPEGAAVHNPLIQMAFSLVAMESIKIYNAISDGTVNLVDKFFEMQRSDAVRALDIYRKAGHQAEKLSEFYEICKSLDTGRGERFVKIEQPPASFLEAMEEYVREVPRGSTFRKEQVKQVIEERPTVILAIENNEVTNAKEERPPSPPPPPREPVMEEKPLRKAPDLVNLEDSNVVASDLDEKNASALAIVPVDDTSTTTPAPKLENGTTGWELALVTIPSSNETASNNSKLAGGLDKLTLDSLYDDAIRRTNQTVTYNPWEPTPFASSAMHQQPVHDPFFASNTVAAPHSVQMAAMANQQHAFMLQQQQQMMGTGPRQQTPAMNPFGNPYAANSYGPGMPMQPHSQYTGLL